MQYSPSRFLRLSCLSLLLVVAVIVWGAFVRSSGSGAGCGAHWPLCDGEIIPKSLFYERIIEYTHRTTSGVALLAVFLQFFWSRKIDPKLRVTKLSCLASLVLILIEAGIGAGLVLFELVADNDSLSRATIIGVHLLNSMLLLASMVLTPWSFYFKIQRVELPPRREIISAASLILLMLLVGATGAVTALGNTLFPSTVLLDGIRDDFASTSHILIRLRIIHPILACVLALFIAKYSYERMCRYPNGDLVNSISKYLIGFTGLQVTMGVANVVLLAPTWLQMLHLIGADLCWMLLIVLIGHQYAFSKQSSKASGEDVQTSTIEERVTSNG